jgi:hypothetical protein
MPGKRKSGRLKWKKGRVRKRERRREGEWNEARNVGPEDREK